MKASVAAVALAVGVGASGPVYPQAAVGARQDQAATPIVLLDSNGKVAGRALTDTMVLLTINTSGVVAPAFIRPLYDDAGRPASGLATWQSGGSVLFMSGDCGTGAYIYGSAHAGVRSTTQVQTPGGTVLYVGTLGNTTTVAVHSILYDNGCSPVTVQQNGLLPVEATVDLTMTYPPPLSFQ